MIKYVIVLLLLGASAFAQKKLKTIEVSDTIASATIDRAGDLYIVTKSGVFQKFDKDGKLVVLHRQKGIPTLFDPRDGARLFAYYRNIQHYDYLSPSFEINASYNIDSAFVIQPWLICTSGEQKLWILDAADHSLKKVNAKESEVEIEVVIDSTIINDATDFSKMREYQNFVFLLHPQKGIFVFNSLGKYIKTVNGVGIKDFHFLGEELYYNHKGKVKFLDLFSAEQRELDFSLIKGEVIISDERLFAVREKAIDFFEYKP